MSGAEGGLESTPRWVVTLSHHSRARAALGVLLAACVLELAVRTTTYTLQQAVDPEYQAIVRPGSSVRWGREGHGTSTWSADGVRGAVAAPSTGSVLVLGDSQVEALMVDDDEVFTAVANDILHGRDAALPPIVNAGRSSASLADHVVYAERFARLFAPSWTVVVVGDADLAGDAFDDVTKPHFRREEGRLVAVEVRPPARGTLSALLWDARQESMLVGYAVVRLGELREANRTEPPLFFAAEPVLASAAALAAHPVEEELELLRRAYDDRLTLLYLPTLDVHAAEAMTEIEARVIAYGAAHELAVLTPRDELPGWIAGGRSPYGHPNTAFNQGHLNPEGHRLVADLLVAHVEELRRRDLL